MDYKKIRLELFICIDEISFYLKRICVNSKKIYVEINENNLSESNKNIIAKFIYYNNFLINFTKKYNIKVLMCLDYFPNTDVLSKIENDYCNFINLKDSSEKKSFLSNYTNVLDFFKYYKIDNFRIEYDKLDKFPFYSNRDYNMTQNEKFYSFVFSRIADISINLKSREYIGYVLKLILPKYNYDLIRNVLHVYIDDYMDYSKFIKGETTMITTFNEDKFEYVEKIIKNQNYFSEYDDLPIEDFEISNIESKSDLIAKLISNNLIEIKKSDFVL
jgi:hypothetical protein